MSSTFEGRSVLERLETAVQPRNSTFALRRCTVSHPRIGETPAAIRRRVPSHLGTYVGAAEVYRATPVTTSLL